MNRNSALILTLSMMSALICSSCSFSPVFSSDSGSGESQESTASSIVSSPSSNATSEEIPQSWIDMFTFDNVTIKATSYAMGTKVSWMAYVDGIRYIQNDDGTYERADPNGGEYYDWKNYYNEFSYDSSFNKYTATDIYRTDEYADNWLNDVEISFNYEGNMSRIEIDHHMASVHFQYVYEFSGYGATKI